MDFMSTEAPSSSLSVELPEPAVGAEVDCPGGNDVEGVPPQQETEEDSQKSASPSEVLRGRRRPKRPEDRNCTCCNAEFERQGRSFNRRAVYTFTSTETVQWAFPGAVVHEKSFLCEPCAQFIRSKGKRTQNRKRPLWLKPPVIKKSELRNKKKGRRMGKKSKAAELLSKSCYRAAFKLLWSAKGARKPMMEFWRKQLKEEMKTLMRQTDNPFHQKVSSKKPLSSFPWRHCLDWAQDKAPLVTSCLTSLFPDINALSKSSNSELTEEQAQTLLERRAVVALSIPLFTRNIWKNNFLQAALGAELCLQGCSGSSLHVLNTMGLCQNKDTVRLLLLKLRNGKNALTQNGQRMLKQELLKGEHMADVEEEEEEEEEVEEEEGDDDEEVDGEEDDEEEAVDDEEEAVDDEEEAVDEEEEPVDEEEEPVDEEEEPVDEEQDEEEMEMAVQEEVEVENQVSDEKAEITKKRRKKAGKQRKKRGKRKVQEREEEEVEEEEEDDEGSEQKKKKVVVVRLGLLKGHSEVGRSDLSAP